ncbi:DUF4295 domain-containing protein [Hugenholtzia roseola]|uniref:DUF4295 domain-containing protein n=1 Tax=Hugenholtzia roseola TaxID=1002 RepID=UPI000412105A|nr:DUF4295 domain-containing protein [Hugenholtzia roseola]
MAKKVVAKLRQEGAQKYAKVIRTIRSPKTGAYTFREEIVAEQLVADVLKRQD